MVDGILALGQVYSDFVRPARARCHARHSTSRPASSQMSHPSRSLNHADTSFVKIHILTLPRRLPGHLSGIHSVRV